MNKSLLNLLVEEDSCIRLIECVEEDLKENRKTKVEVDKIKSKEIEHLKYVRKEIIKYIDDIRNN